MKKMVYRVLVILVVLGSTTHLWADVDFERITAKFKKELQVIDTKSEAGGVFKAHASEWFGISKDVFGFVNDLSGGTYAKEIKYLVELPNWKYNFVDPWSLKVIRMKDYMTVTGAVQTDYLHAKISSAAGYVGMGLTVYSLASDIYKGLEGDDKAKISAIKSSYSLGQGLLFGGFKPVGLEGIGWSSLSVAMFGVAFLDYSLNKFITAAWKEYEEAWYRTYEYYLNKTYGGTRKMKEWVDLAEQEDGGRKIEKRLFGFWNRVDILDYLHESQQEAGATHRVITSDAVIRTDQKAHKAFAARYWKENFHQAFKGHVKHQAELAKIRAELKAKEELAKLKALLADLHRLKKEIEWAREQMEKKAASLKVVPENTTVDIGEKVTFDAIAKYTDGKEANVTDSASWTGGEKNVFFATNEGFYTVTATFRGFTGKANVTVRPKEEEKKCPENSHWDSELKKCVCDEGYEKNEELGKCISIDGALDDMGEDEGEEEDICSEDELVQLYDRLLGLIARAEKLAAGIDAYYNKFLKEIGDQNADPCKNNLAAYCLVGAEKNVAELEALVDEAKGLSTELIMRFAICPELGLQLDTRSLISDLSGLGRLRGSAKNKIADMHTTLGSYNCDPDEMRQQGEQFAESGADPNVIQDGGFGIEIEGDGVDNDGDGLQDEEVLSGYNITMVLYDSGSLKDDIFDLSVSGLGNLGTTPAGGLRTYGANLSPGTYTATVTVILAPDDVGTFTLVIYENRNVIASSSGGPPEGSAISVPFTVTGK